MHTHTYTHTHTHTHTRTHAQFECCGVESYKDYRQLFDGNTNVPESCCNPEAKNTTSGDRIDCKTAVEHVTDANKEYVYSKVSTYRYTCIHVQYSLVKSNLRGPLRELRTSVHLLIYFTISLSVSLFLSRVVLMPL